MKILLIIDSFGSGGAQRQIINLGIGLKKRGYSVSFFNYHPDHNHLRYLIEDENIRIFDTYKKRRLSLSVVFELRNIIKTHSFDICLSYLDVPSMYLEFAKILLLFQKKIPKMVVSERFMYLPGKLPKIKLIQQYLHVFADYITVNSEHQKNRMINRFPWMKGKIETIYNGVDLNTFYPLNGTIKKLSTPLRLIAIGTIVEKKNVRNTILALAKIKNVNGCVPIVRWVGKVDDSVEGKKYFSEMKCLISKLELDCNWIWEGENKCISTLLRNHDLLIHPAFHEGLPNAICEAIASGLPVLASNVCDHPVLVVNGKNGLLFDPNSPVDIADKIELICNISVDKYNSMSVFSRKNASVLLSPSKYISRYESVFKKLDS